MPTPSPQCRPAPAPDLAPRRAGTELVAHAAKLAIVVVPYGLGRAFIDGRWNALHLAPVTHHYDVGDYVYFFLVATLNGLVWVLRNPLGLGLIGFAAVVFATLALYSGLGRLLDTTIQRTRAARWGAALRRWVKRTRVRNPWYWQPLQWALFVPPVLGVVLIALLLLVVPLIAYDAIGRADASDLRTQLRGTAEGPYPHVYLAEPTLAPSGTVVRLVECPDTSCVVAVGDRMYLLPGSLIRYAGPAPLFARDVQAQAPRVDAGYGTRTPGSAARAIAHPGADDRPAGRH